MEHEKICPSRAWLLERFPYFVQAHGAHFIMAAAGLASASPFRVRTPCVRLRRRRRRLFHRRNHFTHTARKNINLTYVSWTHFVYGSPRADLAHVAHRLQVEDDIWGSADRPIIP